MRAVRKVTQVPRARQVLKGCRERWVLQVPKDYKAILARQVRRGILVQRVRKVTQVPRARQVLKGCREKWVLQVPKVCKVTLVP